jgi:hypothetical protein
MAKQLIGKEILSMILDWDRSEFTSYRSKRSFKAGAIGLSNKPEIKQKDLHK